MFSFRTTAVLSFRAILLVTAGLFWNGVAAEAHARCGGLPLGQRHFHWSEGRLAGQPSPAPLPPRCHGPSCSDAPLPTAPTVVTGHPVNDGLLMTAATSAGPDLDDALRCEDRIARTPDLSGGIFRPPRV